MPTQLMMNPGDIYGKLTLEERMILLFPPWGKRAVYWLTRCSCGSKEKMILENSIRRGAVTSCGCHRQQNRQLDGVLAALRAEYRSYRSRARKFGREFAITEELFAKLMLSPCSYCHKRPSRTAGRKRRRGSEEYYHTTVKVSGIDRMDSTKGYTTTNCVPSCVKCNLEKGKKSVDEYLSYRFERTVRELCRMAASQTAPQSVFVSQG